MDYSSFSEVYKFGSWMMPINFHHLPLLALPYHRLPNPMTSKLNEKHCQRHGVQCEAVKQGCARESCPSFY